jgi:hypothetical protein
MADSRAALGLRAHSGWAALVAVGGTPRVPEVLDRRRIEIADPEIEGSLQPYHAAEELALKKAGTYLRRCEQRAAARAEQAFGKVLEDLRTEGYEAVGCGLLLSSARPLPELSAILASHALIHAADGEHFRDALRQAASHFDLPLTAVPEKELYARASAELTIPIEEIQRRIGSIGKSAGPPWTQDQKLAALSGWLALGGSRGRRRRS